MLHAETVHQLVVAYGDEAAVHPGHDAVAADLLHISDPAAVDMLAVGLLDAFGDGMAGGAFHVGRVFQQLLRRQRALVHRFHGEIALGDGAGLVKGHRPHLRQGLQIVGALDEDALIAGAAQAGEEAQRDADDHRAGAADDQEGAGPEHPVAPQGAGSGVTLHAHAGQHAEQGWQHGQGQGRVADDGGVIAGEFGDEVFGLGLAGGGVLHQIQDLGGGGLVEFRGGADAQVAGHVDAAAEHVAVHPHFPGQALAGEGGGVQSGNALHHHAVQGHLFAGVHHDDAADLHLVRVHPLQLAVDLKVGIVGPDVHQLGDVAAALAHGVALEQLAHLIKQHDGHAFAVFPQHDGAHGGHGHEEVLVEHLAVFDAQEGLAQDVVAHQQVGYEEQQEDGPFRQGRVYDVLGDQVQRHEEQGRDDDPPQQVLLFFVHRLSL